MRTETSVVHAIDEAPASLAPDPLRPSDKSRLIWRSVFPKALGSGLFMSVLIMLLGTPLLLPIIPPFCAALAVFWYARREKTALSAGMGARIGAVTGFCGFIFQALMFGVIFLSKPGEIKAVFHKQIEEAIAHNPNPQAQAMAQNLLTPEGMLAVALLGLAMFFVFYLILGSLGGAIGSSFTRKKQG